MTEERKVEVGDVYLDKDNWMRVCLSATTGVRKSDEDIVTWAYLNANSLCLTGNLGLLKEFKPEKGSKYVLNLRNLAKDILKKE
jgi:hypothetical protein